MDGRVIEDHVKPEVFRRQLANGSVNRIGRDDAVALRADQGDARIEKRLLRVENVEGRALADAGFFARAGESDLRRGHRRLRGIDRRTRRFEQAPGRHDRGADSIALQIGIQPRLPELLLSLADVGIFNAALIKWHVELQLAECSEDLRPWRTLDIVVLRHRTDGIQRRQQSAFLNLYIKRGDVDLMEGGDHARMFDQAQRNRGRQRFRQ